MLLDRGAAKVYAADVGHGQLHASLKADPRVVSLEGLDARRLTRETVPEPVGAITADVSFISLIKALGPALELAAPGAFLVALVKPQFEVGPERIGKGGIVRDAEARDSALQSVTAWLAAQPGWRVAGAIPSPSKAGRATSNFSSVRCAMGDTQALDIARLGAQGDGVADTAVGAGVRALCAWPASACRPTCAASARG